MFGLRRRGRGGKSVGEESDGRTDGSRLGSNLSVELEIWHDLFGTTGQRTLFAVGTIDANRQPALPSIGRLAHKLGIEGHDGVAGAREVCTPKANKVAPAGPRFRRVAGPASWPSMPFLWATVPRRRPSPRALSTWLAPSEFALADASRRRSGGSGSRGGVAR